jgi:hypothetical protein
MTYIKTVMFPPGYDRSTATTLGLMIELADADLSDQQVIAAKLELDKTGFAVQYAADGTKYQMTQELKK